MDFDENFGSRWGDQNDWWNVGSDLDQHLKILGWVRHALYWVENICIFPQNSCALLTKTFRSTPKIPMHHTILVRIKKSLNITFSTIYACRWASVCRQVCKEGGHATHRLLFWQCKLNVAHLPFQLGIVVTPTMKWEQRRKPSRNESVASSVWLGIHKQTSQISGNRKTSMQQAKTNEGRGMRCEGKKNL